jgi:hypothetical protein
MVVEKRQTEKMGKERTKEMCYAMLCYAMLCYAMLCYAMVQIQQLLLAGPDPKCDLPHVAFMENGQKVSNKRVPCH